MHRMFATLILLLPIGALADPMTALDSRVLPNGDQVWRFAAQWQPKFFKRYDIDPEQWLIDQIGRSLSARHLCAHGWEIISRTEAMKNLIVEGRCKPAQ